VILGVDTVLAVTEPLTVAEGTVPELVDDVLVLVGPECELALEEA
jgi:hypothetical protein